MYHPSYHLLAAVATEQYPHERAGRSRIRASASVCFEQVLYYRKIISGNDCFMGILYLHPFPFRFRGMLLYLIINLFRFPLDHMAQIDFIGQYPLYGCASPSASAGSGKAAMIGKPHRLFIFLRGEDAEAVQFFRNRGQRQPFDLPCENPPHILRRIFINNKPVFIRITFSVPVGSKSGNTFPIFILYRKLALYLCGNIPAVGIVYEIFDRQDNRAFPRIRQCTVKMVGKRNESHTKSRESLLYVPPGFNVIAPETGQVFHYHAVHPACLNIADHPLKFWPVEITP